MPIPNSYNIILYFTDPTGEPILAGTSRILQCLVDNLSTYNDPNVTIDINILFNGSSITNNSRQIFDDYLNFTENQYILALNFNYLVSSLDTGEYTCIVSVTSSIDSSYVVDSLTTKSQYFTIEGNIEFLYYVSFQY